MIPKNSYSKSLYTILGTLMVTGVILITSLDSTYVYLTTKDKIIHEMKDNSKQTLLQLKKNIASFIVSYSVNEYENLIFNAMEHREFFAIVVEDYNMGEILGKKAYITGKIRNIDNVIVDFNSKNKNHLQDLDTSFYTDKYDILNQSGNKIASISIFITDKIMQEELNKIITRTIIKTILISILIIFTLFIIIRIFVLIPINSLINISTDITNGNLDTKINVKGSLEIEHLSYSFEIMRDKIKEYIHNLENKVQFRTQELEDSNETLEQTIENLKNMQIQLIEAEKMASLGSLVAGVAHEINTPVGIGLTGITHFLEITRNLKKQYETNNMSEDIFEDYINTSIKLANSINTNLERTVSLIQSFKQVSVDQTSEEKRKFDLKEYLNDILLSIHNLTKKTNLTINIKCSEKILMNSYPGVFSQIFTNFIVNSVHHAYKKNEKGTLSIELFCSNNYLHLIYKDDGCGINDEILPKVFEPFFTTNREFGGSGLGLNIIYNIVTSKLKGSITCESPKDRGVVFTIVVPLNSE